ncbi:MAG: hypothetical protein ACOCWX_06585 [Spirochaetota bacterium]
MAARPHSVYSTWGLHDELGDQVRLTEALVGKALDDLDRWRARGVVQDFFHIDCFWFDPEGGYLRFHPETWPNGFEPTLKRILDAGMTPGLWYSTNGLHMQTASWAESLAEGGRHYSLAEGPYADRFEEALLYAAREWKVRLYKFDFANFFTTAAGSSLSPEENYRRSQTRFLQIVRRLKDEFPDAIVITHCGFWRRPFSIASGSPQRYGPDRSLFAGVDRVFSGDPHMFNPVTTSLTRNTDLYQDREVWKMLEEGYPLDRIEDHGAIIGTTNTCHYRGRAGIARTHIGQLARGERRDFFYGDPALPTDDDLDRMRRARALFFDAWDRGLPTSFVGAPLSLGAAGLAAPAASVGVGAGSAAEPGVAPWHGWLTGEGHTGVAWLVNASMDPVTATIDLTNLTAARVLYHDGPTPPALQSHPDVLTVRLLPEQAALVGLGEYADEAWGIGSDPEADLPAEARPAAVDFHREGELTVGTCTERAPEGMRLFVAAQVYDTPEYSFQRAEPYVFARQSTKTDRDMTPHAHRELTITAAEGEAELDPVEQIPDVPIWSGTSWVARTFATGRTVAPVAAGAPVTIRVAQGFEERRRVFVRAWWVG